MTKEEVQIFHIQLSGWHENNRKQLSLLANGDEPVFLQGKSASDKIEVTGDILKGLRLGALMALEVIGELPYEVDFNEEE